MRGEKGFFPHIGLKPHSLKCIFFHSYSIRNTIVTHLFSLQVGTSTTSATKAMQFSLIQRLRGGPRDGSGRLSGTSDRRTSSASLAAAAAAAGAAATSQNRRSNYHQRLTVADREGNRNLNVDARPYHVDGKYID